MAYGLFEMKVGAGDTILAWMTNQAEHVTTILAAARLGINVVNAKDFDGEIELATAISKSNCKCIIYSGASKDVPGDGHDLLKTTIPQLVHGEAWEFGPKILKVPAFPSLKYVLTTRWDRADEGMINFKDILMYDAMTRYSPPSVDADTPLGSAVTSPGQLSRTFTQGELLAAAEKLSGELQLDSGSKLVLTDQSLYGVALGTTIALQNTIPLVIPSELPDKSALEQAQHDEGDMVVLEPAVVDSLLL